MFIWIIQRCVLNRFPRSTRPDSALILKDVSLTIERGTFIAVMGPSGSGKSTLMQCAAGLDNRRVAKFGWVTLI